MSGSAQPISRRVASSTMTIEHDREGHVGPRQVVDVVDAVDDVVVVPEQVDDRRAREREQRVVETRRRPAPASAPRAADEQEGQHDREQEMRAAEDDRLGRARDDDPHVVESHAHGDRAGDKRHRARVPTIEPRSKGRSAHVHSIRPPVRRRRRLDPIAGTALRRAARGRRAAGDGLGAGLRRVPMTARHIAFTSTPASL